MYFEKRIGLKIDPCEKEQTIPTSETHCRLIHCAAMCFAGWVCTI